MNDFNINSKVDEILNGSSDPFSSSNKSNNSNCNRENNYADNEKENINLSEFKIDSKKFEKYSIFNNDKLINSSFERIKNLNSLLNREIEKKKKGSDEEIGIVDENQFCEKKSKELSTIDFSNTEENIKDKKIINNDYFQNFD
eukprot:jgi/Orpsp1_1/1187248/evm.model.d7180000056340.1